MRIRQGLWVFNKKSQEFLESLEFRKTLRTFKGSCLSILCGFILAGIIIACLNVNPFVYFAKMFSVAFHPLWRVQTFQWLAIFVVAALSVGIGFAAGLFNIGVAGQMLAGSALSTVIVNLLYPQDLAAMNGGVVLLVFIICVLMSTFLAVLSGWLKTRFNIHEVVSTIMLNWIVWYTIKFVFAKWQDKFAASGVSTNPFPPGMLNWGSSQIAVPLLIGAVCVIFVWIFLKKTVFGFNVKAVGYSETVAKYAGVNVTQKVLTTMAISGFLAGIASFLNVFTISPNIFFGIDALPTVGYDAIAVTLVAFNNPWGIVLVAFLWAIAQSSGASVAALYDLPSQMSVLIFGLIVYFAAISIVFIRWEPVKKIRLWYYIHHSPIHKNHLNRLHDQAVNYRWWKRDPQSNNLYAQEMKKFQLELQKASTSEQREGIKMAKALYKKDFKEQCQIKINHLDNEMKNYEFYVYETEINRGQSGLKRRNHQRLILINQNALETINHYQLQYVKVKNNYLTARNIFINHDRAERKKAALFFKQEKQALIVWKEGELGIIKGDFTLKNGKLAAKGEYQKNKNLIKEDRKVAHSEFRLSKHLLRFDHTLTPEQNHAQLKAAQIAYHEKLNNLQKVADQARKNFHQTEVQLQKTYTQTIKNLEKNPQPLTEIKIDFENRYQNLKINYQKALENIDQRLAEHATKINVPEARKNYQEGLDLAQNCEKQLTYFAQGSQSTPKALSKLQEEIKLITETLSQVYKIYGGARFKEFDDSHFARQKTGVLIHLSRLLYCRRVQKEILITNEKLAKTKKINRQILRSYHHFLHTKKFANESGLGLLKIKMRYDPIVVKAEKVKVAQIDEGLEEIENKYLTQEGK